MNYFKISTSPEEDAGRFAFPNWDDVERLLTQYEAFSLDNTSSGMNKIAEIAKRLHELKEQVADEKNK